MSGLTPPPAEGWGEGRNGFGALTAPIIELRGISKRFGPVEVLRDVDLRLGAGRVHSLAGENGAGKSTMVKILAGVHRPDGGQILLDGKAIELHGTADARRHGIAVVHQHPALFPDLSVAENIFAGRQRRRFGRVDWAGMRREARELLSRVGMGIDVGLPLKMLGVAERHGVEIARALSFDARVLVMDEPTSAISGREVARLFELVGRLKQHGVAILFISHFIDEILSLGDDVTILRSGRRVLTAPAAELTPEQTVRHMIGSDPGALFPKEQAVIGAPVLQARGLSGAGFVENISFDLHAGEILGLFGLVGAGRSEIAEMLFGTAPHRGEIRIDGRAVRLRSPRDALALGISLLPEDRHLQGLVLPFPIRANETLPILPRFCRGLGLIDSAREERDAAAFAQRMRVVASGGIEQLTSTLSGGNQQKVLLAKWLLPGPRILILDQPTRGIDVGAKAEIHRIVSHLAAQGLAIILISDEAPEVIAMADRILVLRAGRVAAEFAGDSVDREAMMLAAAHTAGQPLGGRAAAR